jgi:Arc/MetJ-type ribon-helix-helix transcriptional regulator
MDVKLPADMQGFVDANVKNGRFAKPEDVVVAALAAFMSADESFRALTKDELEYLYPGMRQKIEAGLSDLREGRVVDGEEFFEQLDQELDLSSETNRKTA